ncbi:MAG: TSUP family transporter, partial [Gammaproteobacteria bacterium]|nr:TSUP family transporter [Gammaproteobacteria bacterium]
MWCLALGALSGFLAGLLGIGGGLVIVPVLIALLPLTLIEPQLLMPMVLGTSLAAILLTSISALLAHKRSGNIPVKILPPLI